MKSKTTKITELIEKRDKLSIEITRYWSIINSENVIKKEFTRNYDLKQLLTLIKTLAEEQVNVKLRILCANMGIKFKDLSPNCNQITVFRYGAAKEYFAKLSMVKTIDPVLKAKKGKKNLKYTEELTHNYLKARSAEIVLQVNELSKKMIEFNETTELVEDGAPMHLVA